MLSTSIYDALGFTDLYSIISVVIKEKFQRWTGAGLVLFHRTLYVSVYLEFGAIHLQQKFSVHILVPEFGDILLHV